MPFGSCVYWPTKRFLTLAKRNTKRINSNSNKYDNKSTSSILLRLKAFHEDHTHIHVALRAMSEARTLARAELTSRCACDAFVPTHTCHLRHHFIHHCSFFLLLPHKHTHTHFITIHQNINPRQKNRYFA